MWIILNTKSIERKNEINIQSDTKYPIIIIVYIHCNQFSSKCIQIFFFLLMKCIPWIKIKIKIKNYRSNKKY